jgi:hypothetical protein
MNRREAEQACQLVREKALYQYSSALERGDFEVVSAVLKEAEGDAMLERMLLEVNEVYQAEMEGQQTRATFAPRTMEDEHKRWSFARLLWWTGKHRKGEQQMVEARDSHIKRDVSHGNMIWNGLIAGGVLLGIALTFAIGFGIYTGWGRAGGTVLSLPTPTPAPMEAPAVVELPLHVGDRGRAAETDRYSYRAPAPGLAPTPIPMPAPAPRAATDGGLRQPVERLIVHNGSISMVVEDTRAAQQSIEEMVVEMAGEGAYVVSSEEHGGIEGGSPYIAMTIRVPATRFDEAMDRLADLAVEVTARNESGQDVTEEYVDLEARLESLETARQRLLEIMQDARTTDELLKAEQQLTQREADIESIKGQMQYLAQSAQLAGIWIELQPYILGQPVSARWRPAESVREAVETLVDSLRSFGDFLIFFVIAILPWAVVVGLVAYGVVRFVLWRIRVSRERRPAGG